ncbi:MAG: hypothetical protein KGH60_02760 [Candidatus Micrarchaeota archaeon]|nr:hypothetical protein [Candidatus Micrarchaeota archaeon]
MDLISNAAESMSTKTSDLEKPSKGVQDTSYDIVYFRSFTDIPNAGKISEMLGAESIVKRNYPEGLDLIKPMIPYFEARYKSADALIKANGITQVVEFAAGRTPRGINNPQWHFIHTDYDTLALSQMSGIADALMKGRRRPVFSKLNAITGEGIEDIIGTLRKGPVAVTHEGLFSYYPPEYRAKVAGNVKKVLEARGGIYITPDLNSNEMLNEFQKITDFAAVQKRRQENTGRDLDAFRFESTEAAIRFMEQLGFDVEVHNMGDLFYHLASVDALFKEEEENRKILNVYENFKILKMKLR